MPKKTPRWDTLCRIVHKIQSIVVHGAHQVSDAAAEVSHHGVVESEAFGAESAISAESESAANAETSIESSTVMQHLKEQTPFSQGICNPLSAVAALLAASLSVYVTTKLPEVKGCAFWIVPCRPHSSFTSWMIHSAGTWKSCKTDESCATATGTLTSG